MEEMEKLLKLGLKIKERTPKENYEHRYFIYKPKSSLEKCNNSENGCYFIDIDNPIELGDVCSNLCLTDEKWIFRVWEYTPGPGSDDFVCEFIQLQSAIDAIINFYFGKPTIIQDWVFPLHRHPELQFNLIGSVIKNAVKVTQKEFDTISTQLWEQVKGDWPFRAWEKVLIGDFLKISHVFDKSRVLMVRRDLHQSFLVCN